MFRLQVREEEGRWSAGVDVYFHLITICVCDLVGTFVQSIGSRGIIHIEMDPVMVNMVLYRCVGN